MAGPHGRPPRGMKPQVKNPGKLFKRVMEYVFRKYKYHYIIFKLFSHFHIPTSLSSARFRRSLEDSYHSESLQYVFVFSIPCEL